MGSAGGAFRLEPTSTLSSHKPAHSCGLLAGRAPELRTGIWLGDAAISNSTLVELCTAPGADVVGDRLSRPYAETARIDRPDGGTHFQLPTGPMIKLLRESGFLIDELTEFVVPADAHSDYEYVTPEWASTWPSVELWKATRH
jgi:hypothetical protein